MNQIFRFCLRCTQISLIKDKKCSICKGDFILSGLKDNFINENTH